MVILASALNVPKLYAPEMTKTRYFVTLMSWKMSWNFKFFSVLKIKKFVCPGLLQLACNINYLLTYLVVRVCLSVWCSGDGHRVTAEQFMWFLNREQRDPRLNEILHPYCDLSKAQSLISKFEPNDKLRQAGTYLRLQHSVRNGNHGLITAWSKTKCSMCRGVGSSLTLVRKSFPLPFPPSYPLPSFPFRSSRALIFFLHFPSFPFHPFSPPSL